MDIDDSDAFSNQLKVEITVGLGDRSTVQFVTVVTLPDYTDKVASMQKLVAITDLLRGAIPFQTLKGEERDYGRVDLAMLDKHGNPVTREAAVKLAQEELRTALKKTGTGGPPP